MTYNQLRKIAESHIRKGDNLPSNALLLATQLHINYKTEIQCKIDFKDKQNPLNNSPAFLYTTSTEKTIYFNSNTHYWNFYFFHEIAHHILGHETSSPQNEMDADLLACILAAPLENFPSYIKSARDLSSLCQIPIDKAEMYWREIRTQRIRKIYLKRHFIFTFAIIVAIFLSLFLITLFLKSDSNSKESNESTLDSIASSERLNIELTSVVVSPFGAKYHLPSCRYISNKDNLTEINITEAEKQGYSPCKICFHE